MTLAASRDILTMVVALEVVSLPAFALVALRRFDSRSSEAALKLFLVSVVSTAVMLFGLSLVYGLTGAVSSPDRDRAGRPWRARPGDRPAVTLAIAGFAFKVAAVPFHAWAGDVYQGAPSRRGLPLRHLQGGRVRRADSPGHRRASRRRRPGSR